MEKWDIFTGQNFETELHEFMNKWISPLENGNTHYIILTSLINNYLIDNGIMMSNKEIREHEFTEEELNIIRSWVK